MIGVAIDVLVFAVIISLIFGGLIVEDRRKHPNIKK